MGMGIEHPPRGGHQLVNNAGFGYFGSSHELTCETIDLVFATNVRGPLLLSAAVAKLMASSGGGSIVNISSSYAKIGGPENSLYAATKGAIDSLTRSLASEWGHAGVRVNAIRPGATRTASAAPLTENPELVKKYLHGVPLGRIGECDDIAECVLYLASPVASYVTGQIIDVDGGLTSTSPSLFA
jgi:NAD(P)-dependent dehydrogenase (short-subunit alcohol dehydrogenase family)